MEEIFPIAAGVVCGVLLGAVTARRRLAVGLAVSLVAGFLATVLSGEWRVSWGYLVFDVILVAACATASLLASRWATLKLATERSP